MGGALSPPWQHTLWFKSEFVAPIKEGNTRSQNSTILAAIKAANPDRYILKLPPGDFPVNSASFAGWREVRGVPGDTILNASTRTSNSSIVTRTTGTLDATEYALNADTTADGDTAQLANAVADPAAFAVGMKLRIGSLAYEYPGAATPTREWVTIKSVSRGGSDTTLTFTKSLDFVHTTANSASVQIYTPDVDFFDRDIIIKGTGQFLSAGPGDFGYVVTNGGVGYCEGITVEDCERGSFRFSQFQRMTQERCSARQLLPQSSSEVRLCHNAVGTFDLWHTVGCRAVGGYQSFTQTGGEGWGKRVIHDHAYAEGSLGGITEHDGLIAATYIAPHIKRCGTGIDMRSPGREIIGPRIYNLKASVNGIAGNDAAFVLRDRAGCTITDMDVKDVGYILRAENTDDSATTRRFAGDQAPGRVQIKGGHAEQFTNGIYVVHTGSENTEFYSGEDPAGTYNTTETGPYIIENLDLLCSGKVATPTTSVRPLSFEGYVKAAFINNVNVEFPSGVNEYYSELFLGSGELHVSGGKKKRTRGILFGAKSDCIDEAGDPATLTPTRFACPSWPDFQSIKDGDAWLNSSLSRVTTRFTLPPAQKLAAEAPPITAPTDTSENIIVTLPLPAGWAGKRGVVEGELLFVSAANTNTKTVRARLGGIGGTIFHQSNLNSATNVTMRLRFRIANTDYAVQVGAPVALTTFGSTTGAVATGAVDLRAAVDLVLTVEKATGADSVVLHDYDIRLQPG